MAAPASPMPEVPMLESSLGAVAVATGALPAAWVTENDRLINHA